MSWSPLVPLPLLADPKLTDAEVRVLVAVLAHVRPADARLTCWPSNARLAEMTGKAKVSLRRILAGLETKGYVARAKVSDTGGRILTIVLPYDGWALNSAPPRAEVSTPPAQK